MKLNPGKLIIIGQYNTGTTGLLHQGAKIPA